MIALTDEQQQATARVPRAAARDRSSAQYLTFMLGGEMFAIGILAIKEIIEYWRRSPRCR